MSLYPAITSWYHQNKRPLPWRNDEDPYKIWVSEIMLQQTRIEAVIGYYKRFLSVFPTLESLANAPEETLLKVWQGLGYYSRVKNMKKTALMIQEQYDGVFPLTYDELIKLPGIGPYTAAAIASFAGQQRQVCVDGNILRVYARLYAYQENVLEPAFRKQVESHLLSLLEEDSSGFNQGMMELGETICLVSTPRCEICPCRSFCLAYQQQLTNVLPIRQKDTNKVVQTKTIILAIYDQDIVLRKRSESLLHNMYEPLVMEGVFTPPQIAQHYSLEESMLTFKGHYQHQFSHRIWEMDVYQIILPSPQPFIGYDYVPITEVHSKYPIALAYYKWLKKIL